MKTILRYSIDFFVNRIFLFLLVTILLLATILPSCTTKKLESKLPDKLSTTAEIYFISLPSQRAHSWRYDVLINSAPSLDKVLASSSIKARVYCFRNCPKEVYLGSLYRANMFLEKNEFPRNPSGFNYGGWLERNGFIYTGKLFASSLEAVEDTSVSLHAKLIAYLIKQLEEHDYRHQYLALVTGFRGFLSPEDRQVMVDTGTMHLLVVSGLHLGFIFLLVFSLFRIIFPLSQSWAGMAGLLAMLGYAWLANFSLATQRALLMATLACLWLFPNRRFHPWLIWLVALTLVMIINQPYMFDPGLWLSFGTVALLLLIFFRQNRSGPWWQSLLTSQWYLVAGLSLLQLAFFDRFTLISVIANIIAIPVTGFVILPILLLGCILLFILPSVGHLLLNLLDLIFALLWQTLEFFGHIDWAKIEIAGEILDRSIVLVLATALALIHILPRGSPGKYITLLLLPLLLFNSRGNSEPTIWIFDSRDHSHLLYREGNYGLVISNAYQEPIHLQSILYSILPSLRYFDIDNIDWITLSHPIDASKQQMQKNLRNSQRLGLMSECTQPDRKLSIELTVKQLSGGCQVSIKNKIGSLQIVANRFRSSNQSKLVSLSNYVLALHPDDLNTLFRQTKFEQEPVCILPSSPVNNQLGSRCKLITTNDTGAVRISLHDWKLHL